MSDTMARPDDAPAPQAVQTLRDAWTFRGLTALIELDQASHRGAALFTPARVAQLQLDVQRARFEVQRWAGQS